MRLSLDTLLQRALEDPSAEPALLRALLSVTLFVHRPLGDDHERLRIVQFTRPDGLEVIPVFTDVGKANAAAQGRVAVIGVNGRALFEATRGATLMLDPNDASCTLYPEEIGGLLDGRPVARAPVAAHVEGVSIEPSPPEEHWIGRCAAEALASVPGTASLYQFHARHGGGADPPGTLLAIGVPHRWAERAARAVATRLHPVQHRLANALDIIAFEPDAPTPDWLSPFVGTALWRRDRLH